MLPRTVRRQIKLGLLCSGACGSLLLLIIVAVSPAQTQRPPPTKQTQPYRDLAREYLDIRRAALQFEEEVRSEREDYYRRTKERFDDLNSSLRDMLWDILKGKSPNRMPDLSDLVKLVEDYGRYVGDTATDLVDLHTTATEIDLRMQKANQRYAQLRREQKLMPPNAPPPPDSKPANLDELDGAIDLWGYKELGDRYFDGRPEAWKQFLAKHPEYKRGVKPSMPPDKADGEKEDASENDVFNDDAEDMFGYMTQGEHYFDKRPGDWERFKQRYPNYKDLTWAALEASEHAELKKRTLKEFHIRCTAAEQDHKEKSKSETAQFNEQISSCNSIKDAFVRSECLRSARESHARAVKSIEDALKQANETYYCGRDDDFSRVFDRRFP